MLNRKLIRLLRNIFLIIISLTIIFLVNGFGEKIFVNKKIQEFKSRAIYVASDPNLKTHYYKVLAKYDYEDTTRNIFDQENRIIGSKTDIIITNRNPMRDNPTLNIPIGFLATNFYVGHATINSTDSGDRMYEVLGNSITPEENQVIESSNDWLIIEDYLKERSESPNIIGLRVKNTTEDQRNKVVEYLKKQEGKTYNFTFLFNRHNTFYCTDLVSRAFKHAGINVNYDYLATTGNDIIMSKNTYIIFYRETLIVNGKKEFNIYYLE